MPLLFFNICRPQKTNIILIYFKKYAMISLSILEGILRMRNRIFQIIETAQKDDRLSNIYDIFMMIVIVASLIPLAFKSENTTGAS